MDKHVVAKILKKIISPILGKKNLQIFFEWLYKISILGMNIGPDWDPNKSGEKFVAGYINKKIKTSDDIVVFDVGANVGKYTSLLKEVFENRAKIFAFEPSEKTFKKLESNIELNDKIRLYNFGFGDKNMQITLFSDMAESGLASIYKRNLDHFGVDMNIKEEVSIKKIDDFCEDNNINHINFLKLDTEGNEKKILDGALKMLNSKSIDFIQFEFGGCNIDSRTYFQDFYYLLKDKYKIFRILKDGLYEIKKYDEMYEIFITTNFLAERLDLGK